MRRGPRSKGRARDSRPAEDGPEDFAEGPPDAGRSGGPGRRAQGGNNGKKGRQAAREMTEYIFHFEIIRQYPTVRSFMLKQPLKRSFKDSLTELLGGSKKGMYKL